MSQKKDRTDYPAVRYGELLDILPVMTPKRRARFEAKVDRSAGPEACHPWQGAPGPSGYGLVQGADDYRGFSFLAHRVAWAIEHEQEPGAAVIRHSCDNPPCCNARHLLDGTQKDNAADMVARGRAKGGGKGRFGAAANAARYTQSQRNEAIRLRYDERMPFAGISRALGVHRSTLYHWFSERS